MEQFHGTTIVSVRRDGKVALGGDGQVTLGNIVVKGGARKVRRLHHDQVLAGFAGATADAFTLFERFEAKLDKHQGHLVRSAIELTKDWRTDRVLRRLEAMLAVADHERSLIITGNGDVLEPEYGIVAIGSGGAYAQAAAKALLDNTELGAERHRQEIARDRRRPLHLHEHQEPSRSESRTRPENWRPDLALVCRSECRAMTPQEIVSELDRHIVGQAEAKRAVAIALRNRWRRQQVDEQLRGEITPKNILMIGPTGRRQDRDRAPPGAARRRALHQGRGDQVHRGRLRRQGRRLDRPRPGRHRGQADAREAMKRQVRTRAEDAAEERILDVLVPPARCSTAQPSDATAPTRQELRKKLREGVLDDKEIEIEVAETPAALEIMGPPGMEEMTEQLRGMFANLGGGRSARRAS